MTTRRGGFSTGPYASFNLASHVGDDERAVAENRRRLRDALSLPNEPQWLNQVHGRKVAMLSQTVNESADAAVAFEPGPVAAVLTADCLPVFLTSRAGDCVGIAHAGWRGLVSGVVEATVAALATDPSELIAWLGPAIGPAAFEVGGEVRRMFVAMQPESDADFRPGRGQKYLADLPGLARRRLVACGVTAIHGGEHCTVTDPARFYSYRRDGQTGRMAALIWLA
ncbi:MAG: peptidoglycan editing factor PgeF [Gammaproteobacteria bacterium]|nr:peptidoglycan editing factor PgeF [Gammaproteobacteria bacterium]